MNANKRDVKAVADKRLERNVPITCCKINLQDFFSRKRTSGKGQREKEKRRDEKERGAARGKRAAMDERETQMKRAEVSDETVSIVFSGKFRRTMERVDLPLMNVYYISVHVTLGFEVTSFRVLRGSSCLPRTPLLFRLPICHTRSSDHR